MNVLVMAHRADETDIYEAVNRTHGFNIAYETEVLTLQNAEKTRGYEAVAIHAGCPVNQVLAKALAERGVKYLLTRSTGMDHMDLDALKNHGIQCANVPAYAPNAISEHTVMLLLMLVRKMKKQMRFIDRQYFFLQGLRGRQVSDMTVGVIGTGRIGTSTIRNLSGLGCKILAYDLYPNQTAKAYASYVELPELLRESDAVILHCPLTGDNHHLIGRTALETMKEGAFLVNTARGGLVDTEAVCEALQSGRLSGFAMDVYEKEQDTQRKDYRDRKLDDPLLERLLAMEQVIFTTHTAFYTDEAIESIAASTLENLEKFIEGEGHGCSA